MYRRFAGLLAVCAVIVSPASNAQTSQVAKPLYQLRVYQLNPASKAIFHDRFAEHAMRIMHRHGFDIVATWEADHEGKPEFVYLLRWTDEAAMTAQWAAFMADAEWAKIKRETVSPDAPIMGGIDTRTMRLTAYSPPFE
ncbi:MAG: NIPSNAP family protein [Pseudomonadota bacterium]|uniref:NIPSNAP family protein n=1 Tax=Sphingomonas sp. ERG5 TaxID=1381597 RepID=UPI00054C33FF|nr:NIPSNAP family protein [Sphingomonas sp. ERG5]